MLSVWDVVVQSLLGSGIVLSLSVLRCLPSSTVSTITINSGMLKNSDLFQERLHSSVSFLVYPKKTYMKTHVSLLTDNNFDVKVILIYST